MPITKILEKYAPIIKMIYVRHDKFSYEKYRFTQKIWCGIWALQILSFKIYDVKKEFFASYFLSNK